MRDVIGGRNAPPLVEMHDRPYGTLRGRDRKLEKDGGVRKRIERVGAGRVAEPQIHVAQRAVHIVDGRDSALPSRDRRAGEGRNLRSNAGNTSNCLVRTSYRRSCVPPTRCV